MSTDVATHTERDAARFVGLGCDLDLTDASDVTERDCPVDDCGHPDHGDEPCTYVIMDGRDATERACDCLTCETCGGRGVTGAQPLGCGGCDGTGLAGCRD